MTEVDVRVRINIPLIIAYYFVVLFVSLLVGWGSGNILSSMAYATVLYIVGVLLGFLPVLGPIILWFIINPMLSEVFNVAGMSIPVDILVIVASALINALITFSILVFIAAVFYSVRD